MTPDLSPTNTITHRLWNEQSGAIYSIESMLVATFIFVGGIVMLAATRDSVVSELSDVAGSVQDINASFSYFGAKSASASSAGSQYGDQLDASDPAGDVAGAADNCITFNIPGLNEGDDLEAYMALPRFSSASGAATLSFGGVTTGVNGTANGTIGDGTNDTNFNISVAGGNLSTVQSSFPNELRFYENNTSPGTFTLTFDDPVANLEFWVRNMANINASDPENLLGNFTVTLSDGTVLNNAAFTVNSETIARNTTYGDFRTGSNDRENLSTVTRSGNQFVTDGSLNGTSNQAAGRLTFDDVPSTNSPVLAGDVGIQSITFERSGGPSTSYRSSISVSGNVLQ